MKQIICIVCPNGCHLTVDEDNEFAVIGNQCERGLLYGSEEVKRPVRMVTSTVAVTNAIHPRCPVKLDKPIDKRLVFAAMKEIQSIVLQAPVSSGDVVLVNVCSSGASFIATRSLEKITGEH